MFPRNKNYYSSSIIVLSVLFAIYLAFLPIDSFVDRDNYLIYASAYDLIFINIIQSGFFSFIFNEPFFISVIFLLSTFFGTEDILRVIIAFSTFSTFYLVLRNVPKRFLLLALLILLSPQVLKNNIIHLRQGLAVSVFLWGWFSTKPSRKIILLFLAALTHSSFFIVDFSLLTIFIIQRLKISNSIKYLFYSAYGLALGFFGIAISAYLGARQGLSYEGVEAETSGLNFIYWLFILVLYLSQGKIFFEKNAASLFFIILYLTTYFTLPVTARVFESVLIIVLLASLDLRGYKRQAFYILYVFYFIYSWYFRIFQPGFGWDVINYH